MICWPSAGPISTQWFRSLVIHCYNICWRGTQHGSLVPHSPQDTKMSCMQNVFPGCLLVLQVIFKKKKKRKKEKKERYTCKSSFKRNDHHTNRYIFKFVLVLISWLHCACKCAWWNPDKPSFINHSVFWSIIFCNFKCKISNVSDDKVNIDISSTAGSTESLKSFVVGGLWLIPNVLLNSTESQIKLLFL